MKFVLLRKCWSIAVSSDRRRRRKHSFVTTIDLNWNDPKYIYGFLPIIECWIRCGSRNWIKRKFLGFFWQSSSTVCLFFLSQLFTGWRARSFPSSGQGSGEQNKNKTFSVFHNFLEKLRRIAQWHRLQRHHSVKIRASGPISRGPNLGPQQNHNEISVSKCYDAIALFTCKSPTMQSVEELAVVVFIQRTE